MAFFPYNNDGTWHGRKRDGQNIRHISRGGALSALGHFFKILRIIFLFQFIQFVNFLGPKQAADYYLHEQPGRIDSV